MDETLPTSGPIQAAVYPALSYDEFGRLLRKFGYPAQPALDQGRFGFRTLTEPRFSAWMQTPFRHGRHDEFASVFLFGHVTVPTLIAPAALRALQWELMFAHLTLKHASRLVATHTLVVHGGVTEHYIREQLGYWVGDLERIRIEVRSQTRRAMGSQRH
jgi:hypothetical protein